MQDTSVVQAIVGGRLASEVGNKLMRMFKTGNFQSQSIGDVGKGLGLVVKHVLVTFLG